MPPLRWLGTPPAAVKAALMRAGLSSAGPDAITLVVGPREPRGVAGPRLLWLPPSPPGTPRVVRAIAAGAYAVVALDRPDAADVVVARVRELAADEPPIPATPGIIADSAAARAVLRQAWRAARTTMSVLLTGETGTGKEVLAGLLHHWSERRGPYLPINCAAIPNELMESELFGHVRGAFSGAVATVDGKLLAAKGGTVFLDEIDDTPPSIQAKLLRVLEDGEVTRVGETESRRADFRLVAATNRDLLRLVDEGKFGRDLYERLGIVHIRLPALTERREDVPAFVRHFLARFYERNPTAEPRVVAVAPEALEVLALHPWPGNIRELRNVVYGALVAKRAGTELLLADVLPLLRAPVPRAAADGAAFDEARVRACVARGGFNLRQALRSFEACAVRAALAEAGDSATGAARLLGEVGRGRSRDPGGTVRAMIRRLDL